ncbi:MAG: SEC-C metal-binding domain-containing protein [Gemmatimonadota bacterium]
MIALLEDGEEVGWIVEHVVADPAVAAAGQLRLLLEEIRSEVAPATAGELPEDRAPEEPAAPGSGTEVLPPGPPAGLDASALEGLELPPGMDLAQIQQVLSSPRGALLADFSAFCEEQGFSQEQTQSDAAEERMRQLHDEWLETPRQSLEGRRPSEVLEGGRLFPSKVETYRRDAPKVGRNDPCPCGSGRKYKKCCGRAD